MSIETWRGFKTGRNKLIGPMSVKRKPALGTKAKNVSGMLPERSNTKLSRSTKGKIRMSTGRNPAHLNGTGMIARPQ